MPTAPENRHERMQRFVARVLDGATHRELAAEFGVSDRTIRNWFARPAIRQRLDQAIDDALAAYSRRVAATAGNAHAKLVALLESETEQTRLYAACAILAPLNKLWAIREATKAKQGPPEQPPERADTPADIDRALLEAKRRMGMLPPAAPNGQPA